MTISKQELRRIINETVHGRRAAKKRMMDDMSGGDELRQLRKLYPNLDDYFNGGWDEDGGRWGGGAWVVMDDVTGRFVDSGVSTKGELGKLRAYDAVNADEVRSRKANAMAASEMGWTHESKKPRKNTRRKQKSTRLFEKNVRHSMVNVLLSEGLVTEHNMLLLYEEAGNVEALEKAVMKGAKTAGAIGKLSIKALATFIKPIAGQALEVAKETGKWSIKQIGPALSGMGKFLGQTAGGAVTGIKDLVGGVKNEKDIRKMAETDPDKFKKIHASYLEAFEKMELPVKSAKDAAAFVGISETDEGKEVMEAAAKKAGVSVDDLLSQLNLFGQLVRHLDAANEAASGVKGEGRRKFKITKKALERMIREEYTDLKKQNLIM